MDQRRLLGPADPDDTGEAAPDVEAALAAYSLDPSRYGEALAAVCGARLLVPVMAALGEQEQDDPGLDRDSSSDKSSDMATVLLAGADGRLALLAFTSTQTLAAWNPEARPVPVPAQTAAQAALQEGAAALLVDLAGPTRLTIQGEDLSGLALGWELARIGERVAWLRPAD